MLDAGDTTWYRERLSSLQGSLADPVASPSSVGPSQRAQRGGSRPRSWLKVRAIPRENEPP
jgi:hypothetical protein